MTISSSDNSKEEKSPQVQAALDLCEKANERLEEYDHNTNEAILLQSLAEFEEALVLDPQSVEALLGKAYIHGLMEDYEKGQEILFQARELVEEDDDRVEEMINELNKMKIEHEEEMKEHLKNLPKSGIDIPMLVKNGVMTKEFYQTLTTIFSHFDKDKDGALNTKEIDAFWKEVNGEPIDDAALTFLSQNFDKNKDGFITLQGFLELYLSQTAGSADETWKDLQKLGFDMKLKKIDDRYNLNK